MSQMNPHSLYSGPSITSVLPLLISVVPEIAEAEKETFNPLTVMFQSYSQSLIWYNNLQTQERAYFDKIDKYIANLVPGEHIEVSKIAKPENIVFFYKCLSYVILGADLFGDISFNSNFTVFKLNHPAKK